MSNGEPPLVTQDINLLGPSQNPQEPKPLLAPPAQEGAPRIQHPNAWRDTFADLEAGQQQSRDRDLMRVFRASVDVHPDLAAEANRIGVDLGFDARMAEDNIEKVRKLWQEWEFSAKMRSGGSRLVMESMLDPRFARIARDDIDNLSVIENLFDQFSAGDLGREMSRLRYKQRQQSGHLSSSDERRLDEIDYELSSLPQDSSGHNLMSLVYGGSRMVGGMWDTALASGLASVSAFSATMAIPGAQPAAPAMAAWAGLSTLGIMSGQQIAGEAYGEMRRLGISHTNAKNKADFAGFAGGLLEAGSFGLVGGKIFGKALKKLIASRAIPPALAKMTKTRAAGKFLKGAGYTAAAEVATELTQELTQWGLVNLAIDETEDKSTLNLDERGDLDLSHTFWETLRGVAILSVFGPAIQFRNNTRKAKRAQVAEQWMNELGDAVTESKLSSRDKDVFQEFLEQAGEQGGAPKSFFFELDTFTEMMGEAGVTMEDLEKTAPEVAADMRAAEANGLEEFEIPTSTFGAKFLSEAELGRALIPHARPEAGGMTAFESVVFEEDIEAIAEQGKALLADEEKTSAEFRDQIAEARKRKETELVAAGQLPREAAAEAAYYGHTIAVLANQLNMTPAEFEAEHGLDYSGEQEGVAGESLDGPALEQRGTEPLELFSALSRGIEALPTKSSTAAGWKQAIAGLVKDNTNKVKQDEVFWTGIDDWLALKEGKVTKEEFVEFLQQNGVSVDVRQLGGEIPVGERDAVAEEKERERLKQVGVLDEEAGDVFLGLTPANVPLVWHKDRENSVIPQSSLEDMQGNFDRLWAAESRPAPSDTKFGDATLVLAGGKNYREVLVTLPSKDQNVWSHVVRGSVVATFDNEADARNSVEERDEGWITSSITSRDEFRGSHFDQPNVVAHLRLNDREGPNGERVLFVEEVQSDWAQAGRKSGFAQDPLTELPDDIEFRPSRRTDTVSIISGGRIAEYERIVKGTDAAGLRDEGAVERIPDLEELIDLDETVSAAIFSHEMPEESTFRRWLELVRVHVPSAFIERDPFAGVGKVKGFGAYRPGQRQRFAWAEKEEDARVMALEKLNAERSEKMIPRAPFVETTKGWLNLALKQAVMMAVNEGYDSVAFINGEQSAARYDLSRQVESIDVEGNPEGSFRVAFWAKSHEGDDLTMLVGTNGVVEEASAGLGDAQGKPLDDVVGKNVAEKIMAAGQRRDTTYLKDEDLAVGGEGMKDFYDSIVPKAVKKLFGKKGEVGRVDYAEAVEPVSEGARSQLRALDASLDAINARIEEMSYTQDPTIMEERSALMEERSVMQDAWNDLARRTDESLVRPFDDKPDPTKQIGTQNTLTITDKLRESVETEGGLPLFQDDPKNLRGSYFPDQQRAILTKDANPSTVMHEMVHHFANVMLRLATSGKAPKPMLDNVDTMMRFWKIDGETAQDRLDTWNSMSFKEQAPHQESLAYNYELWLFEGTAPTAGLAKLFAKIRTFMVGVYTSLVQAQRKLSGAYEANFGEDLPGMTPELREMFARMVAGEQAATKLEAEREMGRLFETEEEWLAAGNPPEQWDRYLLMDDERTQQLITDLNVGSQRAMDWATGAKGRVLRERQRENKAKRKVVREDVAPLVEQEPIYKVIAFLKQKDNALDRDTVLEALGDLTEEETAAVKKQLGRMVIVRDKNGDMRGPTPDQMAEFTEFETGKMLVEALVAARPLKDEIEARTTAEMERRYGEPMDPASVEERVELAVHSEARSRFVAAELKFLENSNKPARVMLAGAREAARRILASRQLNDMDPRKFAALEARANAAARRAMKPVRPRKESEDGTRPAVEARGPDPVAAIEAKRRALLYNQLTKLALEAREEIAKVKGGLFKRVAKDSEAKVAKNRTVGYVMAARALLAQYGLLSDAKLDRTQDFMVRMKEYLPDQFDDFQAELGAAQAAGADINFDHQNMTLDEFRVLREQVEGLWWLSKRDHQVEVDGQIEELEGIVDKLVPVLEEKPRASGKASTARMSWSRTRVALSKVEHYARWLDGGKQGDFSTYLFLQVKEAVDSYRSDATVRVKQLVDILDSLQERDLMPTAAIALEYVRKEDGSPAHIFGSPDSRAGGMSELLGALLHVRSNESNRAKLLMGGRDGGVTPWATENKDGTIDYSQWLKFERELRESGTLKMEHYDAIQGIFDLMEAIKPTLQAAHIKLKGYPFKEVQAESFEIEFPDGTTKRYKGGYVPAGVDRDAARLLDITVSPELTMEELQGNFYNDYIPKVFDGMTKERNENARTRPLSMDLSDIAAHIDKALRYAHVAPAIADMARIVSHPRFKAALAAVDPDASEFMFKAFMRRAVTQTLYENNSSPAMAAVGPVIKYLRRMTGVAIMAFNWVNSMQQFTGLSNALLHVKLRHMKGGLVEYLRRRGELTDEIAADSKFMADRLKNQMFGLTEDMRALVVSDIGKGESLQTWSVQKAYTLQAIAQNIVDIITWKGAFDQAMETRVEGETAEQAKKRAVREADSAVRLSQGSFSPEDVAGYEEGTPVWRAFTQFTSYFNTVLNQLAYADKGAKAKAKAAIFGFTIPMIMAEAIANTFYDRWDDEDDDGHIDGAVWLDLLLFSQLRGGAAMAPGVGGSLVNAVELTLGDRPFGDRVVSSPMQATVARAGHGLLNALGALGEDKQLKSRTVRDVLTAAVLGHPLGGAILAPLAKPLSYLSGIGMGETEPTGPFDFVRGLATGYASKDSKR